MQRKQEKKTKTKGGGNLSLDFIKYLWRGVVFP